MVTPHYNKNLWWNEENLRIKLDFQRYLLKFGNQHLSSKFLPDIWHMAISKEKYLLTFDSSTDPRNFFCIYRLGICNLCLYILWLGLRSLRGDSSKTQWMKFIQKWYQRSQLLSSTYSVESLQLNESKPPTFRLIHSWLTELWVVPDPGLILSLSPSICWPRWRPLTSFRSQERQEEIYCQVTRRPWIRRPRPDSSPS